MLSANAAKQLKPKKIKIPNVSKKHPLNILAQIANFFHFNTTYLNNNKLFAGFIMILINVGSKFITIQFSKSTEEYLKMTVTKQIMVFAMAWLGTRDIYAALILTGIFVIISDHFLNDESRLCLVPHHYRVLPKLNKIGESEVTADELAGAIAVLEKTRKEKQKNHHEKMKKMYNEPQGLE
jgi:hypothetical protein